MHIWENIEENAVHLSAKYCWKNFVAQTAKQKKAVVLPVKISLKSVGCWRRKGEIDMNIEKEKAEIVEKIKTGKELTEDELEELAFNSDFRGELFSDNLIEVIKRDDTRWSKNMTTILEFDGELYAIDWRKGLTEQQENAFYKQPYRVRKTERVITITDYERIEE